MRKYSTFDLLNRGSKAFKDAQDHLKYGDTESFQLALSAARIWSYRSEFAELQGGEISEGQFGDADLWSHSTL